MKKFLSPIVFMILFLLAPLCYAGVDTNILITKGLRINVTTVTSDYVMVSTNSVVMVNANTSPITITLPSAIGMSGMYYNIKKIDNSSNNITIDGAGSETIDGSLTQTLKRRYESLTIISDGTNWYIL